MDTTGAIPERAPRRLVLCFDGTSNKFTGDETDTNIVKIYEMLDRSTTDQFHYYQPGIGSYVEGQMSNTSQGNLWTRFKDYIITNYDAAFGASFVHHVIAGYNFLMRFYSPGDKIFIFGFSRGAYTARFLTEMIFNIGLLSQGNEEMVRFAWATFSDYQRTRGKDVKFKEFMVRFKETYCRPGVKVHFLGLFDCVNSVAQYQIPLFKKSSPYIPVPPADHIRHAVSIHERRMMFKPALFLVDPTHVQKSDIKEVYFAGNHGDVGGGWHCEGANYLLSDIALRWMVDEVIALPDTDNVLRWQKTKVDHMDQHEAALESVLALKFILVHAGRPGKNPLRKLVHDPLKFGRGLGWLSVLNWWFIELLPFGTYQLKRGQWTPNYWPPNLGARRDIPLGADIHPSVQAMRRAGILAESDMPKLGGEEPYDAPPPRRWWGLRKVKPNEPTRVAKGKSTIVKGTGEEGHSHEWSLEHIEEAGAKTWDSVLV